MHKWKTRASARFFCATLTAKTPPLSKIFYVNRIRLLKRLGRRWFSSITKRAQDLEVRPIIVGLLAVVVIIGACPRRALAAACTSSGTDVVLTVSCEFAAGTYTFGGTLTINPGVTVTAQSSAGAGVVINADNIRIDGTLTANGQGYATGTGTGPGALCAGGGHGGNGGNSSTGNLGGTAYGSVTAPITLGSGGGNCVGGLGGTAGGGAIKLVATSGTVIVAGTLSSNGSTSGSASGGGGAGGSIWVEATTITGGGTITANGGNSNSTASGSGAGGRIALYYTTLSATGTQQSFGGTNATTAENGGAGSIYRKQASATNGDLIVDNNNVITNVAYTQQVTTTSQTYDSVTIRKGSEYLIPSGYALTVASGGTFAAGGTAQSALIINGTFNGPAAAQTFDGVNVTHNGTVGVIVDPTIVNGVYTFNTTTALFSAGAGNRVDDVTVGSGGYLVTENLPLFHLDTLTVNSGGTVTHATNTTATAASGKLHHLDISATTSIVVNTGGVVTANDRGYQAEQGPGKGTDGIGGGGGHGGDGGSGDPSFAGFAGGLAYDSANRPVELGSGGGDVTGTSADPTGHGGGAIKLSVNSGGTITIDGTVSANGRDVPTTGTDGAGGAGGSIWINGIGSTVNGTGTVTSNGGAPSSALAGSGGGGMIAVYYAGTTPTFALQARGSNVRGYEKGGAGTVYMKSDAQTLGDLTLDNNNVAGATSSQAPAWPQVYDAIVIKGGANYRVSSGLNLSYATSTGSISGGGGTVAGTLTVNGLFVFQSASHTFSALNLVHYGDVRTLTSATFVNATYAPYPEGAVFSSGTAGRFQDLTLGSGGKYEQRGLGVFYVNTLAANSGALVTHATNSGATRSYIVDISATSTVTIASGASVDVSRKGYGTNSGTGAPGGGSTSTGAGYGGTGGLAFSGTAGITYGSVTQPTDLGSGANASTAFGGGAAKIVTAGTFSLSGSVSANGTSPSLSSGGAAAGSVWIQADTLSGSGTVSANGGNAATNCTCGGGGGGRIALYYTTDSSTYTKSAQGGAKNITGVVGGAGTIYSKSAAQTNGSLLVDNGSQTASAYTMQVAATSLSFDAITIRNGAHYSIPSGASLALASGSTIFGGGSVMPSLTIANGGTLTGRTTQIIDGLNVVHTGAFAVTTDLTIKNATFTSSNTNFTASLAALTVDSGGSYVSSSSTTSLTVSGTITVRSGGLLTSATNTSAHHNSLNISASSLDIQAGGSVSVSGKGFTSSEGYAQGIDNATAAGGGGYGGAGGASSSGAAGGSATYGSSTQPVDIGSAGGNDTTSTTVSEGGPGGGAIKIVLSDTLTLNGTLSANGTDGIGTTNPGGGGAGGSIWFDVGHAILNANVTANGGAGSGSGATGAGGGGGGRVAAYFITLTGSGTSTSTGGAKGGTGSAVAGSAGTVFGYNNPPVVTVTSPNGGESLTGGASSSILFTTVGSADHYRISLSTDSGATFPTVLTSNAAGSPYSWTVNNVTTALARVRVEAMDSSNTVLSSDASNADFSITEAASGGGGSGANPPPAIMVGQPNGGETLQGGSTYNVFWASQGTQVQNIRLSYSLNGGSTYAIITSSGNPSSGFYAWSVPDVSSTSALLKAEGLTYGNAVLVSDVSDHPFTIVGTPVPQEPPVEPPIEEPTEPTPPVETEPETPVAPEEPSAPIEPPAVPPEEPPSESVEPSPEPKPRPVPVRPSAPPDSGEAPPSGTPGPVDTGDGEVGGGGTAPQGEAPVIPSVEPSATLPLIEWIAREEGRLEETPLLDVIARATADVPLVREAVQATRSAVKALRTNETVQVTNAVVLTPAVTGAAAVATTSAVGFTGFASYAMFLVTQPLALLDRRRRKAYGTVYNVGTKLPVDLAIVRLLDATGQKAIATRVTDHLGRYLFLAPPGTYQIEVKKPGFVFPPARTISGIADGPYADLHVGGAVATVEGVVAKNIPLEPASDTRSNAKVLASAARFKLQWAFTAFGPGFAAASYVVTPRWEQVAALAVQLALSLVFTRIANKRKPKGWGVIRTAQGQPVARAIVRVVEDAYNKVLEAQVTDTAGRYAFLVGQNRYFVTAEHAAHGAARTETVDFARTKEPSFIAKDITFK